MQRREKTGSVRIPRGGAFRLRLGCALALASLAVAGGRAQTVQLDFSVPYASHGWNTLGYSGQAGWILGGGNLLGIEWTSFNSTLTNTYPVLGKIGVSHQVESLQMTYRFSLPLKQVFGSGLLDPFEVYAGAGAGLGRVRQALEGSSAVANEETSVTAEDTEYCCELAAGIQFNLASRLGIKVGYRYLDTLNNVRQFGSSVNTDAKVVEIGAVMRF